MNILGPYCSFWHWREQDEEYIRRLQPAWACLHQPTARGITTIHRNSPNTRIMLRSWDIDDNNGERKQELYADPRGAAKKHLDMWRVRWEALEVELRQNNFAYNPANWYLGLVNEPDPAFAAQVVEYSAEAMRLVRGTEIRLGVVASSVGTFSKPSENQSGWALFQPLEKPINDGGHILIVHEYWQPEGPTYDEDAGNLAWRHRSIPLNVPILIGEAGANGYIYGRHSKNDDAGWRKFVAPEQYATQVKDYIQGCDERVVGVLLYMLDYHSKQWESFDTEPAMHQLLAIDTTRPTVASPFMTAPVTAPTGPVVRSSTPAGVNVRSGPSVLYPILGATAFGEALPLIGQYQHPGTSSEAIKHWWQVRFGAKVGWVASTVTKAESADQVPAVAPPPPPTTTHIPVVDTGPVPTEKPVVAPATSLWERSLAFTARWEGGYQNAENDAGNWTGGAVGQGENKGTNWGISASSYPHLDIKSLTRAQAHEIFFRDYWQKSGADQLPWPACLIVFDTAILHGVSAATAWQVEVGTDPLAFAAKRLRVYVKSKNWHYWGNAWTLRVAELLEEAAKE